MEFQTEEMPFLFGLLGFWGVLGCFLASLHALVPYHLLSSRNSMTFLLTGTQQISDQQKQE